MCDDVVMNTESAKPSLRGLANDDLYFSWMTMAVFRQIFNRFCPGIVSKFHKYLTQ